MDKLHVNEMVRIIKKQRNIELPCLYSVASLEEIIDISLTIPLHSVVIWL